MPAYEWDVLVDGRRIGWVLAPNRDWAWGEAVRKYGARRGMRVQEA